jgi:hypothetical protein
MHLYQLISDIKKDSDIKRGLISATDSMGGYDYGESTGSEFIPWKRDLMLLRA